MGHQGDGDVFVFAPGPGAAIDRAEVAAELNGTPARFDKRPAQPLVTLPEQAAVKHPAAAGVSGGDYSGISRQFDCAVETPDTVDLGGDDTAKKRPDSRDALQQLFLCALTLADRSIKLFDLGFEQLGHFQILLQQWLILMSWYLNLFEPALPTPAEKVFQL